MSARKITNHINQLQPRGVLLIVPVLVVLPLAKELNRGLSPVLLLGWHVQVIHKYHSLLPHSWAVHTLTTPMVRKERRRIIINTPLTLWYDHALLLTNENSV